MSRLAPVALLSALLWPAAALAAPWDGQQHWGVGFHATGLGLQSKADPEVKDDLGGAGIQGRYRLNARWELELAADHIQGERDDGLERDLRLMTLGAMFHINPQSQWDFSVVAGLGGAREDVTQKNKGQAAFEHSQAYLGVALERRFQHIAIEAQLRAVGLHRNDEKLDGPDFAGLDVPVPQQSSGGQLLLSACYYF